MKIRELINEDETVKYILYVNGKPATEYDSSNAARSDAKMLRRKRPQDQITIKQKICSMKDTTLESVGKFAKNYYFTVDTPVKLQRAQQLASHIEFRQTEKSGIWKMPVMNNENTVKVQQKLHVARGLFGEPVDINKLSEAEEDDSLNNVEDISILELFGGGIIRIHSKTNADTNEVDEYSYSYINEKINNKTPVVSCEVYDNTSQIVYHDSRGEQEFSSNVSNRKIREIFSSEVSVYLNKFFNGKIMKETNNESIYNQSIWNKDSGLKRAMTLMKQISDSADRHREKIAMKNVNESSKKNNTSK